MADFDVESERRRRPPRHRLSVEKLLEHPRLVVAAGLVLTALVFGTPHLLVTYQCMGGCTRARAYSCDYLGIQGWRNNQRPMQGGCRLIRIIPLKFR